MLCLGVQFCEMGQDGLRDYLYLPASRGSAALSHHPTTVTRPHPMSRASSWTHQQTTPAKHAVSFSAILASWIGSGKLLHKYPKLVPAVSGTTGGWGRREAGSSPCSLRSLRLAQLLMVAPPSFCLRTWENLQVKAIEDEAIEMGMTT